MGSLQRLGHCLRSLPVTHRPISYHHGLARGCMQYTSNTRITAAPLQSPLTGTRSYASKAKGKSTSSLVPGSKQPLTTEASREEYARAEEKMRAAVDWFKKEVATAESRGSGRVTPAMLDPVRVMLPESNVPVKLEQVATVGVRDGNTLLITLFEEQNLKHVEQAIYDAKIPSITPQKQDARTIKIPIPRVTLETLTGLYTSMQRKAEDTRVQLRKVHQASIKRGAFKKHSVELEVFQKLTDRHITELDEALLPLKKLASRK